MPLFNPADVTIVLIFATNFICRKHETLFLCNTETRKPGKLFSENRIKYYC